VAHRIWQANKNKEGTPVRLTGFGTGNGLTWPTIQYQYYGELAYTWCKQLLGTPCISESTYAYMNSSIPSCVSACKECDKGVSLACDLGRLSCNDGIMEPYMMTGRNPYNIRLMCGSNPLCYDFSAITRFFNRADVKASLGADPSVQWHTCNGVVNMEFGADWLHSVAQYIPPMLEDGVRYIQYSGELDYICNWIGNRAWVRALDWSGKANFNKAPFVEWTHNGKKMGWVQSLKDFSTPIKYTFFRVHEAGHLVPMDQPAIALEMFDRFILNKPLVN